MGNVPGPDPTSVSLAEIEAKKAAEAQENEEGAEKEKPAAAAGEENKSLHKPLPITCASPTGASSRGSVISSSNHRLEMSPLRQSQLRLHEICNNCSTVAPHARSSSRAHAPGAAGTVLCIL